MIKRLLTLAVALMLASPSVALACKGKNKVQEVTLDEGKTLLQSKKVVFVDANGDDTRTKHGIIPGAVLLSDSSEYDATKELPAAKDQKMVFYCANTRCSASHQAAARAKQAGYFNVAVLPEGISGWVKAGLPIEKPATTKTADNSAGT